MQRPLGNSKRVSKGISAYLPNLKNLLLPTIKDNLLPYPFPQQQLTNGRIWRETKTGLFRDDDSPQAHGQKIRPLIGDDEAALADVVRALLKIDLQELAVRLLGQLQLGRYFVGFHLHHGAARLVFISGTAFGFVTFGFIDGVDGFLQVDHFGGQGSEAGLVKGLF